MPRLDQPIHSDQAEALPPFDVKALRLVATILIFPTLAAADTLNVGPGEVHLTIQSAIDAASPGDSINVAAGLYPENIVVSKSPLTLTGARAGDDARGRVSGAPDPATESIIAPASGPAIEIASSAGQISVSGFSLAAAPMAASGVVTVESAAAPALEFSNNDVRVAAGSTGSAMWLNRSAENATISRNLFVAAAESVQGLFFDGPDSFDGLHFIDNDVLRDGPVGGTGFFSDGVGNIGASASRSPMISGNRFAGHALGFNGGSRSLEGVEISGNQFDSNTGGMAAGPANCVLRGNHWQDNSQYGLRLTSFGDVADVTRGARDCLIEGNVFENNGAVSSPAGSGDLRIDDQAGGTQQSNTIRDNTFLSTLAVFNNEPTGDIAAAYNYWGSADGPGGAGPGNGGEIAGVGSVDFEPWFSDDSLSSLVYGGEALHGSVVLESGESIGGDTLTLGPTASLIVKAGGRVDVGLLELQSGAILEIEGGSAQAGRLLLAPGAVLEVIHGDLSLDPLGIGQFHTISGTFRFFNCLGSIEILANTTFSGSTLGIASDIHVAPGVTLTVLGDLSLDGCLLESSGTFNLQVNSGATFGMTRCHVIGANLSLVGDDVEIRDNLFFSSALTVFGTVNGAAVFHNVFDGGVSALNVLPGAVVTTTVEGWGNVSDPSAVQNRLSLNFRPPSDPTRTLDAEGHLFVQPGDPLECGIDIGDLADKAQAVESLLGYSTDFVAFDSLIPSAGWDNGLSEVGDELAVIGRFNSAVGLGFAFPDPDGTLLDGEVADLQFSAKSLEGETLVFFRNKGLDDSAFIDTRITASDGGAPYFRSMPFTENSGLLTVDGTIPEFSAESSAIQMQDAIPVDVLQGGTFTRMGTLIVTFDSRDLLAGLDDGDVSVELTGTSLTLAGTLAGTSTVTVGGEEYTRYAFQVTIDGLIPNGVYDVNAAAMDRSGNVATLPIGAVEISKRRVQVTVEPEGLVAGALTREVTFVGTDASGSVLAAWTVPVGFSGGSGSVLIEGVPDGTINLSAKMNWNLRRRLPAVFGGDGLATVSFTGVAKLRGGDLTGNNIINSGDYNVLASSFPGVNPIADITGNGVVNSGDYNILATNWLTAGDPP